MVCFIQIHKDEGMITEEIVKNEIDHFPEIIWIFCLRLSRHSETRRGLI